MLRNVTFAMIVAVLTGAGTVAVLYPAPLTADDVAVTLEEIISPALEVDGCSVTLEVVAESVEAGQPVELRFMAFNPTAEPVHLTVNGSLGNQSPVDVMSRRMMPMTPTWTQPCSLLVPPGQIVEATYTTEQPVGAGATLTPILQAGDQSVRGKTVSVPIPSVSVMDVDAEPATETSAPSE